MRSILSQEVLFLWLLIIGLPDAATAVLTLPEKLSQDAADLITSAGGVIAGTPDGGQTLSVGAWGYFNFGKYMGGSGLFTAMIFGFISVIIFMILIKKKIIIRMPDSVPPAVARAFAAIIPALVSLYVVGVINYIFRQTAGEPLIDWISSHPISFDELVTRLRSGLYHCSSCACSLAWSSRHKYHVTCLQTLYGTAMVENTNAFQNNEPIPFKWVAGSLKLLSGRGELESRWC